MADIRDVDFTNGVDSGDGIAPNPPWKTIEFAITTASVGDTIRLADDTYPASGTEYTVSKGLFFVGNGPSVCKWTSTGTTRIARTSSGVAANSVSFTGIHFDAEDATGKTEAFTLSQNANDHTQTFTDCKFSSDTVSASARCVFLDVREGTQNFIDCEVSGSPGRGWTSTGSIAQAALQTINITNPVLNMTSTTEVRGIFFNKTGVEFAGSSVTVTNPTGTMFSSGGAVLGIDIRGFSAPNIIGGIGTLVITENFSATHVGINVQGSAAQSVTNGLIQAIKVDFDSLTGFGIRVGVPDVFANHFVSGCLVELCTVTGKDAASIGSATPHCYAIGGLVTATMQNNEAIAGFAGFLAGETGGATFTNNITRDCLGPHFYAKGCTGGGADNNNCYMSDAVTAFNRPILAAEIQVNNNTAFLFKDNKVFVSDTTKIVGMAGFALNQVVTYQDNRYFASSGQIPDSTTDDLYSISAVDPSNSTITEWQSPYPTEVLDVSLTKADIDKIIASTSPVLVTGYSNLVVALGDAISLSVASEWVNIEPGSYDTIRDTLPIGLSISSAGLITGNISVGGIVDTMITCTGITGQKVSAGFTWYIR